MWETFSFNVSRNIVALQVERVVARITPRAQLATQQIPVLQVEAMCCAKKTRVLL